MEMKAFGEKIVKRCRSIQPASTGTRPRLPVSPSTCTRPSVVQNTRTDVAGQQVRTVSTKLISSVGQIEADNRGHSNTATALTDTTPEVIQKLTEQPFSAFSTSTKTQATRSLNAEEIEQKRLAHEERMRLQQKQKEEKKLLHEEKVRLQKTRQAEGKNFLKRIQSCEKLDYPSHYKVICINTVEETERHLKQLMSQEKTFGVDLEWPPSFRKGEKEKLTALVQICSSDCILLIQLTPMLLKRGPEGFPLILRQFLEDKDIYKSGVNIYMDGLKLYRDFGIGANGLIELQHMAELTSSPKLKICHLRSLQALTGLFMDRYLPKGKVQLSNWNRALTPKQIKYAALDAYASYELYRVFDKLLDASATLTVRHLGDENLEEKKRPINTPQTSPPVAISKRAGSATNNRHSPTETVSIIKRKRTH